MYDYLLSILTYTLLFLILDALFMIFVLYRSFKIALEVHLSGHVTLPFCSKCSVLSTVIDVYDELLREDCIETLFIMPIHALSDSDLGSETFSTPFIHMLEDGLIEFDLGDFEDDKKD